MAEKKLLNLTFTSRTTGKSYNLGCNSSDNISGIDGHNLTNLIRSDERALAQVGCLITTASNPFLNGGVNCLQALIKAGYGARVWIPETIAEGNYDHRYYLNISGYDYLTDDMPYIVMNKSLITFYSPDGTYLGGLESTPGVNVAFNVFCGKLYEDGTFTGDALLIKPHKFPYIPLYSKNIYDWGYYAGSKFVGHTENAQLIPESFIDIIREYQQHDPEGEYILDGQGDFNSDSDPVNIPELPTASALATGMVKLYQMSNTDLNSLNNYLWSDLFDIDTLKKMFNDPMQAILNLSFSPLSVELGVKSAITIGNIVSSVTGNVCLSQYQKIDFGTIRLNEYWANFADYSPYTRLSIYLPYVGTQTISIDDVMNGSIQLVGFGDVLTGSIVYVLYSIQTNRAGHGHKSVLYSWGGNCQYQIPLTANNMSSVISSLLGVTSSVAGGIAATVATGGITAPIVASALSGTISNTLNAKQQTQRSGGVGGATGIFGVQTPYLILERPETRTIDRYSEFIGEPTESSGILGNFSGYVKVKSVHVGNIGNASDNEKNEIERILKEGVII